MKMNNIRVCAYYCFQDALEVLRTTPSEVNLTVCRPRDEQYRKLSPPAEQPKPPQRTQPNSLQLCPSQPNFSGVCLPCFLPTFMIMVFIMRRYTCAFYIRHYPF